MVSLNEISEQFAEMGIEPSDEVLTKCIDLCITYSVNAEEFVEQWMAYSVSNLNGAEPTLDYLADLERKEFAHQKRKSASRKKTKSQISSLNQYDEPNTSSGFYSMDAGDAAVDDDDIIMDSYACKTPKTSKPKVARTPVLQNKALFSPATHSPIGTPRSPLAEVSGKPCYTFGKLSGQQWKSTLPQKVEIKQLLLYNSEPLTAKAKYMFDNLFEKSLIMGDHLYQTAREICKKHFDCDPIDYDLFTVDAASQDPVKIIGRISCDFDAKLDRNSTLLIGTDELKLRTTRLCFDRVKSYSLFPGQTVLVSGTNPRGEQFYVDSIFAERDVITTKLPAPKEPLSLVLASGPFTATDDLIYEPLHDLTTYCKDNKPDVIILTGPFIDAEHNLISTNVLSESYEVLFEKIIDGILEALGDITICLIASQRDVVSHPVYPTPPNVLKKCHPNVYMLPDPCIIDINGVKIGATSTDILSHLLEEELAFNAGDPIKRVVNYMLHQGSFYPLSPPAFNVCYDSELASKFTSLDELPNILIVPSKERYFLRDINNCLVVNPGYLTTLNTSGTFSRIVVRPMGEDNLKLSDCIASQIVKI